MNGPAYKRVLIKLSGEALSSEKGFGLDQPTLDGIVAQIAEVHKMGVQIGIVVGGGNFWRGRQGTEMDRTTADHMGMLATVINALALQDTLERAGVPTRVQTAVDMRRFAEPYIARKAIRHLEKNRVVIFACGTGNPYFTTDTAASLRAAEIDAEIMLFAKNVDGVYDSDPATNPNAVKFDVLTHAEYLQRDLHAMDNTAIALCHNNSIPVLVFALAEPNSIVRSVCGEKIGTLIK